MTKKFIFVETIILLFCISMLNISAYGKTDKKTSQVLKTGEVYHGFTFVKEQKIPDYNATGKLFIHKKSGATLLKIETEDDNKAFNIAFRTPPLSDCGTPHILEHSVLNGSKNFPVKSPFDILGKTSLNTFLNAMTGSDFTTYPVSSRNSKDYMNLMHVYLDAVFFPDMKRDPRIFKQEGWHYELDSPDKPIVYKGVVYNEMKGAFSAPERELSYIVDKNLFPDTCYGFSSGGYPSAIPKLTYEKFKAFHDKYYHPSNAMITVYGDFPLLKELKFIDEKYLSSFTKISVDSEIKLQKSFSKMKEVTAFYPLAREAKDKDQTFFNFSFVSGLKSDSKLSMTMDVLAYALVNFTDSPVRKAFQKAGIGKEYSCYNSDTKQMAFSVTIEKANPEDREKLKTIFFNTLRDVVKKGIDKKIIEGYLNRMEFTLREPKGGYNGLIIALSATSGWMYANNPFNNISFRKELTDLRKELKTNYFEKMIQEKLLNNKHAVFTMMKPKKGLMEENIAKVKKELADYKKSLTKKELEKIIADTKELKTYQKTPDSKEALSKMPTLELSDIEPRVNFFKIIPEKNNNVQYLNYPVFTKDIIYVNAMFDMRAVPQELIPYASLLANILDEMNTETLSYGELNKEINLHTGGISVRTEKHTRNRDTDSYMPKLTAGGKVLNYKAKEFVRLLKTMLLETKLNDKKRLKEVLDRHLANLEARLNYSGLLIAMVRLNSYFSESGMYDELRQGISYNKFISSIVKDFDTKADDTISRLQQTAKLLLNRNNLIITVTANRKDITLLQKEMEPFIKSLGTEKTKLYDYKFNFTKKNEGITSTSKVQYVMQGYNFKKMGYKYSGKMAVVNKILSSVYMHEKIRVMGGAYGGFSGINPTGVMWFGSYRDPNLKLTLENYKKSPEFLKNFKADKKTMAGYIISTLSKDEAVLTPRNKGSRALYLYFNGITKAQMLKEREEILSTKDEDVRNMSEMVSDILKKNYYCVFGNEKKMNDAKGVFTKLIKSKE